MNNPTSIRRLLRELNQLATSPPEGLRLAKETFNQDEEDGDDEADLSNVRAWVEGPNGTPFEGGYFKIQFAFGSDYPAAPPKCTFITKIFHPNVNPANGDICVSALKKDWKPEFGISHILLVVKCLLIHPNPASALHAEAGRLLLEAFEDYSARAKLMTSIHAISSSGPPVEFKSAGGSSSNVSSTPLPQVPSSKASSTAPSSRSSNKSSSSTSSSTLPLHPSSFSNTESASPLIDIEQASIPGKKRNVGSISVGGEEELGAEKVVRKVGTGAIKKRGLKRL